jgi:hypothetical protein
MEELDAALSVEPLPGGGWQTTLDVEALGATAFSVTGWFENTAGTAGTHYLGACANDRADERAPGERYCALYNATRRDDFVPGGCWIHGCSGFRPAESTVDGPGRTAPPNAPDDAGSAATWNALWTSEGWVVQQIVPSVAEFVVALPSGAVPSPIALCGGYQDAVDSILAASRAPLAGPTLGRRIVDGERHRLGTGLFLAAADDDYTWTAGTVPDAGALAEALGETPTGDHPDGSAAGTGVDDFICGLPGFIGGHGVYDYAPAGISLGTDSAALDAPLDAIAAPLEAVEVVGEVSYGHALEVALPGTQCDSTAIVTGVVHSSYTALGVTVLVFNRQRVTFHRIESETEVPYLATVGGNICATHEAAQLAGRTDAPRRGARLRDRVIRGDRASWTGGQAPTTRAVAFAYEPSEVNWGVDDASEDAPPTPPGVAPRAAANINFVDGDNPTATEFNQANWHDIVFLDAVYSIDDGTEVAFTRDAVHARRPTLRRSNGEAVADADWLWRPDGASLLRVGAAADGETFTMTGGAP